MRNLTVVLEECKRRGIHLAARAGNGLEVRGPLARMPELREELSHHKPNVVRVLLTGRCIHELEPDTCKVCNGYVRRLIESQKEGVS